LIWTLRTNTVPNLLGACYSTIDMAQLKSMLGFAKNSDADVANWLSGDELKTQCPNLAFSQPDPKGFLNVSANEQGGVLSKFELSEEKLIGLAHVVKFLEKKKEM